jgi:predicted RNA-binding Zn-ribbon protein involved in translation (DUF1610 family)
MGFLTLADVQQLTRPQRPVPVAAMGCSSCGHHWTERLRTHPECPGCGSGHVFEQVWRRGS